MRYIDSGRRDPAETLGAWIRQQLENGVSELRVQSGFFNAAPLGLLREALSALAENDRVAHVVLGSNSPGTLAGDVRQLLRMMGLPRGQGRLGVGKFSNAIFHPKTYHIRRADGSQAAYVGSANFTGQGLSLHVEAGLVADSRDGDSSDLLDRIASTVDSLFTDTPEGMHVITAESDIDELVEQGILAIAAPPPTAPTERADANAEAGDRTASPRLRSLVALPSLGDLGVEPAEDADHEEAPSSTTPAATTIIRQPGFPEFVVFAPDSTGPTAGAQALTGQVLPEAAAGLIIRLSRDDTRLFAGGVGTANINLPNDSMRTIRFGILGRGRYPNRPRAEFDLHARYIGSGTTVPLDDPADTNVMIYGYLPSETGHRNNRMLLPGDVRQLAAPVERAGMPLPSASDFALLEWPTVDGPEFRLSFVQPDTDLFSQASEIFQSASDSHELVGAGACWLPRGVSPAW